MITQKKYFANQVTTLSDEEQENLDQVITEILTKYDRQVDQKIVEEFTSQFVQKRKNRKKKLDEKGEIDLNYLDESRFYTIPSVPSGWQDIGELLKTSINLRSFR